MGNAQPMPSVHAQELSKWWPTAAAGLGASHHPQSEGDLIPHPAPPPSQRIRTARARHANRCAFTHVQPYSAASPRCIFQSCMPLQRPRHMVAGQCTSVHK